MSRAPTLLDSTADTNRSTFPGWAFALTCLALGTGFSLLVLVSRFFVDERSSISAIWPANGLALGVLMINPRRRWFALVSSSLAGNVVVNLITGRGPAVNAVQFALVNTAEIVCAAGLLRAFVTHSLRFRSAREVFAFALFGPGVAGSIGAALGAMLITTPTPAPVSYHEAFRIWFVADALGLMIVTPTVVTLATVRPIQIRFFRLVEAVVGLVIAGIATDAIFSDHDPERNLLLAFPYVAILPFLLWAATRFDPRVTAVLVLEVFSISALSTLTGQGPMVRPGHSPAESIITLQLATLLWSLSAMTLATVTAERKVVNAALADSERRARAAEREATRSRKRLQAVFDNSNTIIFMKDAGGRYLEVNHEFERVTKLNAEQVLGRTDHELFPTFADEIRRRDLQVIREGESIQFDSTWVENDQTRYYSQIKFPLRDEDGRVWAVGGVVTDITARKQQEDELLRAKERAELANRAKSEFLANVSHEIRTPLTSIIGYADLIGAPNANPSDRHAQSETIRRNGEHLLTVLNDVLDMSRIEAGRMTIEQVRCDLRQMVNDVLNLTRPRAEEKHLALTAACRSPVPASIRSDPTRLRQILLNITGNAIKFTEVGAIQIDLRLDESHRDAELVIDVSDTGIGMSADHVAKLGQPFTQADPSHARQFGGSGLGMSICYRLAQLLGGSITCQSELGSGTMFTVRIPTGPIEDVPWMEEIGNLDSPASGMDDAHPTPRLDGRVLVAEDSVDTRRLLLTHLQNAGLDVEYAENGQAAVARAVGAARANQPYDLILMDIQMPQLDGLAATSVLRSHGYTGPIVALTANAMEHDRRRCVDAGCDGFLTKPILQPALLEAVASFLRRRASPTVRSPLHAPQTETVLAVLPSELRLDPDVGPLLDEYLHELREKASAIERAIASGDWPTVARIAHQIKGSAGGYGYPSITEAAAEVERAARGPVVADETVAAARLLLQRCLDANRPQRIATPDAS